MPEETKQVKECHKILLDGSDLLALIRGKEIEDRKIKIVMDLAPDDIDDLDRAISALKVRVHELEEEALEDEESDDETDSDDFDEDEEADEEIDGENDE